MPATSALASVPSLSAAPRPKIGRPPALPPIALPLARKKRRAYWRLPLLAVFSVTAFALAVHEFVLLPAHRKAELAVATPPVMTVNPSGQIIRTEAGGSRLTGNLTLLDQQESAPSVSHAEGNAEAAPVQTAIDNNDRQRLLSLLSKD